MKAKELEYNQLLVVTEIDFNAIVKQKQNLCEMEILKMHHVNQLAELNNSLEKSFSSINCLAPRAVIEFVENFKMDASYKSLNRVDKWTKFLTDTEEGRHIAGCLIQSNKANLIFLRYL